MWVNLYDLFLSWNSVWQLQRIFKAVCRRGTRYGHVCFDCATLSLITLFGCGVRWNLSSTAVQWRPKLYVQDNDYVSCRLCLLYGYVQVLQGTLQ